MTITMFQPFCKLHFSNLCGICLPAPQATHQEIGENRSGASEERPDQQRSHQPFPQAEMNLMEQGLPVKFGPESAIPEIMAHFDADKGDKGGTTDITGANPGQLVEMEFMVYVDDGGNPERDDGERTDEDAYPDRRSELGRARVLLAEAPEKAA